MNQVGSGTWRVHNVPCTCDISQNTLFFQGPDEEEARESRSCWSHIQMAFPDQVWLLLSLLWCNSLVTNLLFFLTAFLKCTSSFWKGKRWSELDVDAQSGNFQIVSRISPAPLASYLIFMFKSLAVFCRFSFIHFFISYFQFHPAEHCLLGALWRPRSLVIVDLPKNLDLLNSWIFSQLANGFFQSMDADPPATDVVAQDTKSPDVLTPDMVAGLPALMKAPG